MKEQSERQSDGVQRKYLIESLASLCKGELDVANNEREGKGDLDVATNKRHTQTEHGEHHGCTRSEACEIPP